SLLEVKYEFKKISSLVPSIPKSTVFFCNVRNHVKLAILNIMRFNRGKFPVKYLGVPLISSRILNRDCKILVEKATNRIGDWKNKSLSYAGLQLCKSVISSMQVYWASVLIIPKGIILDIQQLIRGFLWCNGALKREKAKVAWDVICLLKKEGGLGVRSLEVFNIALMTTHIWNIVTNKESRWVRWIHMYKLKGRTIWDVPVKADMKGFSIKNCVADLVVDNTWIWPQAWLLKAPDLGLIAVPVLDESCLDLHQWRASNGKLSAFSVSCAWEERRLRGVEPMAHRRTATSIIGRLVLAASSYFIWLERNNCLFKKVRRSAEELRDIIMVTVRLKLLTFIFKNTTMVRHLLSQWKMPKNFSLYGC
ncbi:hypothetical protein Tco_1328162, partial [Tanacetum coccineum]